MPSDYPMGNGHVFTIGVIIVTVLVSLWGFSNPMVVQRLIFDPEKILRDKESYRLASSALLHANIGHLFFNMFSFYSFGTDIEEHFGPASLAFIYLSSIIGGSGLSLFLHRHHEYRALGASGGVCGVIFAAIFLTHTSVQFILIPIPIAPWVFAIGFLVISFFAMKAGKGNIGHDAHLGGAIIGLIVTAILYPKIVFKEPGMFAGVMGISVVMMIYLVKNPMLLPLRSFIGSMRSSSREPTERKPSPADEMRRVNEILDKISRSGVDSLTAEEQRILDEASRKGRRS
jgi:membrane associated rhomboid family serine protease